MIFGVKEVVGGLPAKVARDAMWLGRWEDIKGPETIKRVAKVTPPEAETFFAYCLEKQWLEPVAVAGDALYEMTKLGIQAGAARIGKPLSRASADSLIAGVVKRAQEWNKLPDVALRINEVRVFGSYVTDAPLLGDVDLVVNFDRRPRFDRMEFEETEVLVRKLAENQGWAAPRSFFHVLAFWQVGMYRYLKARQPGISFSDMETVTRLKCSSEQIFVA